MLLQTSQNYVRCIKPNGIRKADAYDGHFVLRQLRYTGVGAVVAIQRSGYPISMSHTEFIGRYRCIALDRPHLLKGTPKDATTALIKAGPMIANVKDADWLGTKECQIGVTRVYFREEVLRALETPRLNATRTAAVALQRRERGKQARQVCSVLMMHARGVAEVRKRLDKQDTDRAQDALDSLNKEWEEVKIDKSLALGDSPPLLPACIEELKELENELQGTFTHPHTCLHSLKPPSFTPSNRLV